MQIIKSLKSILQSNNKEARPDVCLGKLFDQQLNNDPRRFISLRRLWIQKYMHVHFSTGAAVLEYTKPW